MTYKPKRLSNPRVIFNTASLLAERIERHHKIEEGQKDRWYNALTKATGQLMDGVRYERDGDDTVFPSRTRNGISHRVNGHCSCEAGEKGDPCWHRAASMIINLITDIERITLITPPMAPPECPRCGGYMFDHHTYFVCSACQYTVNASKKERVSRDQAMRDMEELYER